MLLQQCQANRFYIFKLAPKIQFINLTIFTTENQPKINLPQFTILRLKSPQYFMQSLDQKRNYFRVSIRRAEIEQTMKLKRNLLIQNEYMNYFSDYLTTFNEDSSTIFRSILNQFNHLAEDERGYMAEQIWLRLYEKDVMFDLNVSYYGLGMLLALTFKYLVAFKVGEEQKGVQIYWRKQYLRIILEQILLNQTQGKYDENLMIYNFVKEIITFEHPKQQIQLPQQIIQKIIDLNLNNQSQDYLNLLYLVLVSIKQKDIRKRYKKKLIQLGRILYHKPFYQGQCYLYGNVMLLIGFHCQFPLEYRYIVDKIIVDFGYFQNLSLKLKFMCSQIENPLFSFEKVICFLYQYSNSRQFQINKPDHRYFLIIIIELLMQTNKVQQKIEVFELLSEDNKMQIFLNPFHNQYISKIIYLFFRCLPQEYEEQLIVYAKICLQTDKYNLQKSIKTYFCYRLLIDRQIPYEQLSEYLTVNELHEFWQNYEDNNNFVQAINQ